MAETPPPMRVEIPSGAKLAQILRDGITTAGDIREGDIIVYANPPAAPSVGEPESTLASLWGSSPDARRATPDETIANLLAENAALRSSLEEARKEIERLSAPRKLQVRRGTPPPYVFDEDDCPSRAPSPRDEP